MEVYITKRFDKRAVGTLITLNDDVASVLIKRGIVSHKLELKAEKVEVKAEKVEVKEDAPKETPVIKVIDAKVKPKVVKKTVKRRKK
jgi:hypothetical protein